MKIKLDENIPASIAGFLIGCGHDTDTVKDENLVGKSDEVVWKAAQREERFFITQDLDFSDKRKYSPGSHFGILLVRLWMPGRSALTHYAEGPRFCRGMNAAFCYGMSRTYPSPL